MENVTKINGNIFRLTLPYKDIFTTVYAIKTDEGVLLFDAASFDEDVENLIIPFLEEVGIKKDDIKYVFISHKHADHSGALKKLNEKIKGFKVISRSDALREELPECEYIFPEDGDVFMDVLKVVTIPGHTIDSAGIIDTRTKTLISGDSLQLYGIFGSGNWCANISLPYEHIHALDKLRRMDLDSVYTAHDYHPYGYEFVGNDLIQKAIDACVAPLAEIKELILLNQSDSDEEIREKFNNIDYRPTLGAHVVAAVRKMMKEYKDVL